jgi:hypothetical protein
MYAQRHPTNKRRNYLAGSFIAGGFSPIGAAGRTTGCVGSFATGIGTTFMLPRPAG